MIQSLFCYFTQPGSPSQAQPYIVQQPLLNNTVSKTKDPPRYEEAIKQTRNIQPSHREVLVFFSLLKIQLFSTITKTIAFCRVSFDLVSGFSVTIFMTVFN